MTEFSGWQYLLIDVANAYGHDKLVFEDRLQWAEQNLKQLESLADKADSKPLFMKAVMAIRKAQKGVATGHLVGFDAVCSGIQIMSALTGCEAGATATGLIDTGERPDAYTTATKVMNGLLASQGISLNVSRPDAKAALMTSCYGSKKKPKKIFGEGELLALFYDILKEFCPAAWELNETMKDLWNPTAYSHNWILPDNFHVQTKVMDTITDRVIFDEAPLDVSFKINRPMPEGRSLGANMTHSIDGMIVREIVRRCSYDPNQVAKLCTLIENGDLLGMSTKTEDDKMVITLWDWYNETGYLSARILDHLNKDNFGLVAPSVISELLESLPAKPFSVVPVHDRFGCLPHYGNDLRLQYNLQLKMIAESDILSSIISQLIGRRVQIGKLDPTLPDDIMEANYALS